MFKVPALKVAAPLEPVVVKVIAPGIILTVAGLRTPSSAAVYTPDIAKDVYSAMKADDKAIMNAVAKHGNSAENILWGRAINTAKKQVQTMSDNKLKEIIKKTLSTPPVSEKKNKDFPDLTGDGKVTKADILKGRGVDLKEEVDYEGEMAKSELYRLIKNSQELMHMLDDDTQLEAWVQSKITKAADYIASVSQYLNFQAENRPEIDERTEYTLDK